MGVELLVVGQDGKTTPVSNGFGLGIRQRDDVMLAYGYSRKTTKRFSIPASEFAAITLTVGEALRLHHAESRFIESYNGSLNLKIIVGKTVSDMSGVPSRMQAFNQNGATLDPNVKSLFDFYAATVGNPVGGVIDETNTIDDFTLRGQTAQGVRASSADIFASVRGRHYDPGDFVIALFENPNGATIDVTYSYDWHEY